MRVVRCHIVTLGVKWYYGRVEMADTRRTVRLNLTDAEWRALEAAAAKEDRSLSYFVTRAVRSQLTPQRKPKPGKKSTP
jgi:hypothetical protein